MTSSAIALKFLAIVLLGLLALITFLVTLTILGLMVVDPTGCGDCLRYPMGLWALVTLGVFFLISMGMEWAEARKPFRDWMEENWIVAVIALIVLVVFFWIFTR
jgi:uncharacterized BrkB/YihY/UPF0761 family membrane protein